VEWCAAAIKDWRASCRLRLNDGNRSHLAQQPLPLIFSSSSASILTCHAIIVVRDLGVFVDAELTFCEHVRRVTNNCFFQVHRLRQIQKHVNRQVMKQTMHAFVISSLDYCNSILAGLPKGLLSQLQWVQNAAATLVLGLQPCVHIEPALFELHWLPVHLRTDYKLCLLMHSATVQCCPRYTDIFQTTMHHLADKDYVPLRIHFHTYLVPPTFTKFGEWHFQWLVHQFRTLCQQTFGTLQTSLSSVISRFKDSPF